MCTCGVLTQHPFLSSRGSAAGMRSPGARLHWAPTPMPDGRVCRRAGLASIGAADTRNPSRLAHFLHILGVYQTDPALAESICICPESRWLIRLSPVDPSSFTALQTCHIEYLTKPKKGVFQDGKICQTQPKKNYCTMWEDGGRE